MGWLSSAKSAVTSGLTGGLSNVAKTPFVSNFLTNPAKATTVQNTYQGQAPGITQTNFQPELQAGTNAFNQSQQNLGNIGAGLQNLSGQQANIAQQEQGYAGNIAGLSADQAQVLAAQQGLQGQAQGLYGQQQNLSNALLAQSQGQGPNPAQAQYLQNLNLATQAGAGTIASQKGISPALAAQLVANQQGSAYQNAAGSAATLQAQQQLAAQQQLQAQQQAQANNLSGQGQLLNSQTGSIQGIGSLYGQAGNALEAASGIYGQAGTSLGQAGNIYGNQGTLGNQYYASNLQGLGQQNAAITQGSLGAQNISAGAAAQNAKQTETTNAGMYNALGGAASKGLGSLPGPISALAPALAYKGGEINSYEKGGNIPFALALMKQGGSIPGKAEVKGDSPKNDTVPAMLSAGEIVLPRSITQSPDAAKKAFDFVSKLKGKPQTSYGDVVQARKKVEKTRAA